MRQRKNDTDRPIMGERVEVWDYAKDKFEVQEIKSILHMGMKGWTIETGMGLLLDVVPTEYGGALKPAWREWRG